MSRYKGNGDACPHCGVLYGDFKTGFKYHEVHQMLWDNSPDPADWKYKRPGTVLGLWHEMKQLLWKRHIETECPEIVPF